MRAPLLGRPLVVEPPPPRKSVGAEVNWGIRFASPAEADTFLRSLAVEVEAQ